MRITYVTEDTELWGGIAVVFQHLELLAGTGHEVFLTTPAGTPDWYPLKVPICRIEELKPSLIPSADVIVATSWKTVGPVVESGKGIPVHLCQGYEAANKEYHSLKDAIDEAYGRIVPKLAVSRHMEKFLSGQFKADTYYVGQMLDRDIFFPPDNRSYGRGPDPFSVLVVGIFEADVKNIRTALDGICCARSRLSVPLRLVRVSPFPLCEEEKMILRPDEYFFRVPYRSMGKIYREADIFVSVSKEAEGFGLPALEAMGCGVPAILSRISSYTSLDEPQDYALFVDPSDHNAVSESIVELLHNRPLRENLIRRGLTVAEKFTREKVASRLNRAFVEISHKHGLQKAGKGSFLKRLFE